MPRVPPHPSHYQECSSQPLPPLPHPASWLLHDSSYSRELGDFFPPPLPPRPSPLPFSPLPFLRPFPSARPVSANPFLVGSSGGCHLFPSRSTKKTMRPSSLNVIGFPRRNCSNVTPVFSLKDFKLFVSWFKLQQPLSRFSTCETLITIAVRGTFMSSTAYSGGKAGLSDSSEEELSGSNTSSGPFGDRGGFGGFGGAAISFGLASMVAVAGFTSGRSSFVGDDG